MGKSTNSTGSKMYTYKKNEPSHENKLATVLKLFHKATKDFAALVTKTTNKDVIRKTFQV